MKIGILTYHLSHNYGAFLQAYSLATRLQQELPDENVEIINFNMKISDEHYRKVIYKENSGKTILYNLRRYFTFKESLSKIPLSTHALHSNSIEEFCRFVRNENYDIIVAGSDEIWRVPGFRGFPNPYWLPGNLNCIKLSYAAASQSDLSVLTATQKRDICDLLNAFQYVGVRDKASKDEFQPYTLNTIHLNCDPTFVGGIKGNARRRKELLKDKFGVSYRKKTIGLMLDELSESKRIQTYCGKDTIMFRYIENFHIHILMQH